jgi:hypothetical protein
MVTSVSGLYEVAFSEWVVALTGRDGAGFHNHSHSHLFEKLQRVVFFGFPSAVALESRVRQVHICFDEKGVFHE